MLKFKELSLDDELRKAVSLLAASAELHGGGEEEHEMSFDLLCKVLYRLRQIKEAYEGESGNA